MYIALEHELESCAAQLNDVCPHKLNVLVFFFVINETFYIKKHLEVVNIDEDCLVQGISNGLWAMLPKIVNFFNENASRVGLFLYIGTTSKGDGVTQNVDFQKSKIRSHGSIFQSNHELRAIHVRRLSQKLCNVRVRVT